MESIVPLENSVSTSVLVGAGIALFIGFLVSLTLLSWCMGFASRLCGGEEDGFLRSIVAVFASALFGGGAAAAAVALQPDTSPGMSMTYAVIGSVLAISIVMAQNPFRAFGTYLVYSFVATISHVALIGAVVLLIVVAVPREKTEQMTEKMPTLASALEMKSRETFGDWTARTKQSQVAQETKVEKPILADGVNLNPFIQQ